MSKKRKHDEEPVLQSRTKRLKLESPSALTAVAGALGLVWRRIKGIFGANNFEGGAVETIGGVAITVDPPSGPAGRGGALGAAEAEADAPGGSSAAGIVAQHDNSGRKERKNTDIKGIRSTIFADIHSKGFLISPGDVYGGDYCLYCGTASDSHSIATVRLLESDGKMSAREFLAFTRVQNQVAKSSVLAFVDPETSESKYLTSMFSGVSSRE